MERSLVGYFKLKGNILFLLFNKLWEWYSRTIVRTCMHACIDSIENVDNRKVFNNMLLARNVVIMNVCAQLYTRHSKAINGCHFPVRFKSKDAKGIEYKRKRRLEVILMCFLLALLLLCRSLERLENCVAENWTFRFWFHAGPDPPCVIFCPSPYCHLFKYERMPVSATHS